MKIPNLLLDRLSEIVDFHYYSDVYSDMEPEVIDIGSLRNEYNQIYSNDWTLVFCKSVDWHTDPKAYNRQNQVVEETFVVLQASNHVVEIGNEKINQETGIVFSMDATKFHRLIGDGKSIWIGLTRPTLGSIEADIKELEELVL